MNNNLRKIIKERNLKYDDISRDINIGRTTIYQIANKKSIPSVEIALKLSRHLEIPLTELFYLEEE
ncbi:helix-turn-helix transcriptional regulator [Clostridium beijerinckii]|uniref:Helix-turn-helix domain-containing protein n=1 Tax=Clostridium beijerinckii TaxID=1520 RepID=A0AAW3WDT8_CLOBE|nr:helix-turn-helix domain-containing protein [Clostridium beijerinckii]MBC2459388.1 helix-turn-helix domain-containing protein [Clostridium beijerinckii]MBC2476916.1 helix-turn-helix domain-containing protein [Clostridium beijerinckii]NOV62722.1 putative transcriptional regulator [Clostridium beijerinckii]NOV70316.1 putative transcriptional regulator [Clostridium beijerinckii]NOW30776.1 putative transcriptional regulator [Clostridium beijerinckii]